MQGRELGHRPIARYNELRAAEQCLGLCHVCTYLGSGYRRFFERNNFLRDDITPCLQFAKAVVQDGENVAAIYRGGFEFSYGHVHVVFLRGRGGEFNQFVRFIYTQLPTKTLRGGFDPLVGGPNSLDPPRYDADGVAPLLDRETSYTSQRGLIVDGAAAELRSSNDVGCESKTVFACTLSEHVESFAERRVVTVAPRFQNGPMDGV